MTDEPLRVGIVGLGAFGSRVAMRLLWNGFPGLGAYDCNDMIVRIFGNEYGAMGMGSCRMVAQTSDVVITVLPSAAALREACFGWESLADGFKERGVVVDLGVTDPVETANIARELADRGISFVDAPAFGTPTQAKEGGLTLVVGGDDASVALAQPVLDCISTRIFRAGTAGSAQAASALADYLHAAQMLATSEAIRIGEQFGFDAPGLLRLSRELGGSSIAGLIDRELATRHYASGRPLGLVRRNLEIASRLAQTRHVASPLLDATNSAWTDAENAIGFGADQTEILKWLDRMVVAKPTEAPPEPVPAA